MFRSLRMCRILRSEWWQQVRFFRDCLRIACSRQPQQPGTNHRFQDWSRTSIQLTEFLWNQVRPNLPSKKKQRVKEGTVLVLGDRPVAEQHRQILKLGPKFCFEPALKRVYKLALSRLVSRQVPEEEKPSGLRALVSDKEGFFVIMPEDMFAEKATCAVQKNFKAVLEKPAKVKERAVELLERLNLKQVGRLEDAGFPESVIASAAEAIVKSIKVKRQVTVIPYVHHMSHGFKRAASKFGVDVVFSARNRLSSICSAVEKRVNKNYTIKLLNLVFAALLWGPCGERKRRDIYKIRILQTPIRMRKQKSTVSQNGNN
ncbi:hypothetical protein HPB47_014009 [Ixodes persulcatus]|uniref:Uncharacterized protein n=1 Tax=Ixodes persulcatus TaxID=34615 RepID=A0AC60QX05_IXOPE|nr:hypothetical protein HPB47_014009 [Ixodes persulcatus]